MTLWDGGTYEACYLRRIDGELLFLPVIKNTLLSLTCLRLLGLCGSGGGGGWC
jgi:hypothetical protein